MNYKLFISIAFCAVVFTVPCQSRLLGFSAVPEVFSISISFENPNHAKVRIDYKNRQTKQRFAPIETSASSMTIPHLDMSTEYVICLSFSWEGPSKDPYRMQGISTSAESKEERSKTKKDPYRHRDCDAVTTKEIVPFEPSELKLTENTNRSMTISWELPLRASGSILKYQVIIESRCIQKCPEEEEEDECKNEETELFYNRSQPSALIAATKPYWNYRVSVAAVKQVSEAKPSLK